MIYYDIIYSQGLPGGSLAGTIFKFLILLVVFILEEKQVHVLKYIRLLVDLRSRLKDKVNK